MFDSVSSLMITENAIFSFVQLHLAVSWQ